MTPPIFNAFEHYDPRFKFMTVGSAGVDVLYEGCRWAEGPVWFADLNCLIWSDIPNNRMLRYVPDGTVDVFRSNSNNSNGNTRDRQGRLVTCEHGARRVTRTEHDGAITVLADSFRGKRLNSPNDVVVKSDSSIWFTDPPYGIMSDYEGNKSEQEQESCNVYRIDPKSGKISVVCADFVRPNGLAFSPDEKILYIADSARSHDPEGPNHIRAFKVQENGTLKGGKVFATLDPGGLPDGIRLDTDGNVWSSALDGVRVFAKDGTPLGRIKLPQAVSNLTFGGPKRNRLFITSTHALYSVYLATTGAQRP
jgi:gluconolactonase